MVPLADTIIDLNYYLVTYKGTESESTEFRVEFLTLGGDGII